MQNFMPSLIRQVAHASDVGDLTRIIAGIYAEERYGSAWSPQYLKLFHHPMKKTILSTCHKKLVRLVSKELAGQPDKVRLEFLSLSVGSLAEKVRTSHFWREEGDVSRWFAVETPILEAQARILWKEFSEPETFADLLHLWREKGHTYRKAIWGYKLYPGDMELYRPSNAQALDELWLRVFHRMVQMAETIDELKAVAHEAVYLQGNQHYLLSNVVIPKWFSRVHNLASLLEVLNWRSEKWEDCGHFDFDHFHSQMSNHLVEQLLSICASFCVTADDFAEVTKSLGGSIIFGSTNSNERILRRWFRITRETILGLLRKEIVHCSRSGHEQIIQYWYSLGLALRNELPFPSETIFSMGMRRSTV